MSSLKSYLSLVKFSHTIFALPFALVGFFMGLEHGEVALYSQEFLRIFLLVLACMVMARSAAMAFNRYLDREIDAKNPRTSNREIPVGVISARAALLLTIFTSLLFMACCYFINRLCFYLSPVALAVILGYSYTKRFTPLCHLVLGVGLALAPIGAYLAVTASFHLLPILISIAVLFWVSGFDIIYALQDEEFDRSQNLRSIPAWLGKKKALGVSRFLHVLTGVCLLLAGFIGEFEWFYWAGAILFITMLYYQHRLVSPADLSRVNMAFMTTNGFASVIFAIFVITDILS